MPSQQTSSAALATRTSSTNAVIPTSGSIDGAWSVIAFEVIASLRADRIVAPAMRRVHLPAARRGGPAHRNAA